MPDPGLAKKLPGAEADKKASQNISKWPSLEFSLILYPNHQDQWFYF